MIKTASSIAALAASRDLPPDAPVEIGRYALEPEVFCRRCRLTLPLAWRRVRGACRCERPEPALLIPRSWGANFR
jgi:hypothetical protein